MNKVIRPISDAHIHAYVDDELNNERREFVEDYIIAIPLKCRQVRTYRKINELMRQVYNVDKIPYKHRENISSKSGAANKFKLISKQKTVMLIGIIIGVISGWFVMNTESDKVNYNSTFINQLQITPNQATNQEKLRIVDP